MRKCDVCGSAMISRRTTLEAPYAYAIGGLPRVVLIGIAVHRCTACDVDTPVIPKPGELHRVLARLFLRKRGPLAGDELRFLRKHAGISAQDFAMRLGVDPSHLSRVENGKVDSLGETSDRLARVIAADAISPDLVKEVVRAAGGGAPLRKPLMRAEMNRKKQWSAKEQEQAA